MKNTLRLSTHSSYLKVFLSFLLVITMVTTSLPIAYADTETNTVNALLNSAFDNGADNWKKPSGEINVKADGEGETATKALELSDGGNAVYQAVTKEDGKDFIQGSTFKWGLRFKNSKTDGKDDIVALVLGLNEPAGNPDHLRQMITWLKGRKIDNKVPADGQYTVIVYSKPFKDNGTFENKTYVGEDVEKKKENFSLVPTMYCTERFSVSLFRTKSENWTEVTNPETTPYTLNKNSASIYYSLISYSGSPLVDDVNFFIEKAGTAATEFSNLQNGSFEKPIITDHVTNFYLQYDYNNINKYGDWYWKTTATDKKIELFNINNNSEHFRYGDKKVVDGKQSAELNAEEASTLYQYIKTEAGSQYKWSLSHRGRYGADIMALIIGPKQSVDPSKVGGRLTDDQFMQMVDWVQKNKEYFPDAKDKIAVIETTQENNNIKNCTLSCEPAKVTVYSKPFSTTKKGGFESDNNTYFSATQTTDFSEKWDITIICSGNGKWETYGESEDDKYSYYDVPEGQEQSIFAFTAYKASNSRKDEFDNKKNTFGNLLDGVNFDLYYPASSVSFTGGDATLSYVYKEDLLTAELESGKPAKSIMVDENSTFTLDVTPSYSTTTNEEGEKVYRLDANGKKIQNTFLGAYITIGGERKYFPATAINPEDHAVYFSETVDDKGMKTYSFGQSNVSGRVVVELVYSEVYTMIYNSKGGEAYSVHSGSPAPENAMDWNGSNANVARFLEKATCTYTSTACEWWEENPNVVFKGWELVAGNITYSNGTPVPEGEQVLFAGNVKVKYTAPTLTEEEKDGKTQEEQDKLLLERARKVDFVISDGKYVGKVNAYNGGVLVANWEYKTSVVAQTEQLDGSYINNSDIGDIGGIGGTVSLTKHASDITYIKNDTNEITYKSPFNNEITVSGTEKDGYTFRGWYDEDGKEISFTKDHSYTIEPYYSTDNKATKTQTPSVIYARFGLSCKVKFHINDMDTVSTVGNPDADLYRVYYPQSIAIPDEYKSVTNENGVTYQIHNLDSDDKINYFYDIPTVKSEHGKIFKGWYLDRNNEEYSNPIKWDNDQYTTEVNIYAHWIDVGTVEKDAKDTKIFNKVKSTDTPVLLPGIDLLGVQIRYEDKDKNYPNGRGDGDGQSPHFDTDGLRFITCIKEDILEQTNSLFKTAYGSYTKKSLSYGYVIAKEDTANKKLSNGEKLEYKDKNVNDVAKYSFVQDVDCTSKEGGYKNTNIVDHRNYDAYRIYSLVITYKKDGKTDAEIAQAKGQNIVARPYLRYQDANGLYRTYYQDYTGTNVYGGCSTNYTSTWDYLNGKGYFPA